MRKIYLAGFDVFFPDAKKRGDDMKNLCAGSGFHGLFPFDNEVSSGSKEEMASQIFQGNIRLIKQSDIVLANLNNFRGDEPDSGTSFECGVAYALGKRLYGYMATTNPMKEKYLRKHRMDLRKTTDADGLTLEDFDLPVNLMLAVPMKIIVGDFQRAIFAVSQYEKNASVMAYR